jgi:hypothetical protein
MIGFVAERVMELEVGALTGAAYGEKSPERLAQRNGYRERDCHTRAGTLERAFRSCAPARTSRAFSSPAAGPRRRSPP